MKGIAILGSTGSVGRQTLEVIRSYPQHFSVVGLGGWSNVKLLQEQVDEFRPALVCSQRLNGAANSSRFPDSTDVSMEEMVCHPQVNVVVVAIPGVIGILPTLLALRAGKAVALASKEVVVMAGAIVAQEVNAGAVLLPVDSEVSAIWQCLRGEDDDIARLIITASGGPFRTWPLAKLANVTAEEALRHPTWLMGRKITVDSATLMNKAFEVMEAHWFFHVPWDSIEAVLHPQSIVHSMVEFVDGSIKAQMSSPDMRLPLQYALFHPWRAKSQWSDRLDIAAIGSLDFECLDMARYPCFSIGMEAARAGGTYPAVLCAANEVAVDLFLEGKTGFMDIPSLVQQVMDKHHPGSDTNLDDVLGAHSWARKCAMDLVKA